MSQLEVQPKQERHLYFNFTLRGNVPPFWAHRETIDRLAVLPLFYEFGTHQMN